MNLTESELNIIRILRQLVPYEEIRVIKDQQGRSGHYFIVRTQKIVISDSENGPISLTK